MRPAVPTIVTHPSALLRDGLRQILGGTPFRPVHLAPECDEAALSHLPSAEVCVWLMGIEKCSESTFDLVRRVCKTTPNLKTIILAQRQATEDVWPAIEAGARGFLYQNISSERLVKSLELIALGEIVVPADFLYAFGHRLSTAIQPSLPGNHPQETLALDSKADQFVDGKELANEKALPNDENSSTALIHRLSRRETSILRLLIQGAPNKLIARQLVITEATVKVHIKAILRKLRLHNRTQAAMWASSHLGNDSAQIKGLIREASVVQLPSAHVGKKRCG
jgi:two-component system, NarL family, nitrate/nitrite response regulator NarL